MSHFFSAVKKGDVLWYLTSDDIDSEKGQQLRRFCEKRDDLKGHGAIREYFGITGGFNVEYKYFKFPELLPKELVRGILDEKFTHWFGIPPPRILKPSIYLDCVKTAAKMFNNYYVNKKPYDFVDFENEFSKFEEYCWKMILDYGNLTKQWNRWLLTL